MTIQKQEFYEGAALHALVCGGNVRSIAYIAPFFVVNDEIAAYIKYSTKGRTPWGFTFTRQEQERIYEETRPLMIALVCGSDGIAAVTRDEYRRIAALTNVAIRVACNRKHGEHFEVTGPDALLDRKVSPSRWPRLFQ